VNDHANTCSVSGEAYEAGSFSHAVHEYIESTSESMEGALHNLLSKPEWLFRWFSGLVYELNVHTVRSLDGDTDQPKFGDLESKWLRLIDELINGQRPSEARTLALHLYQLIRTHEVEKRTHISTVPVLSSLAQSAADLGQNDLANSYQLLGLISGLQSSTATLRDLPAWMWLVSRAQVAESIVEDFASKVVSHLSKTEHDFREPELSWVSGHKLRRKVTRAALDFNRSVAMEFRRNVEEEGRGTKEKGDALEFLVTYLFAVESGFEVFGSTLASDSQNDVNIRNRHLDGAIASLTDYFLVECKNWKKAVDAAMVREFTSRLSAFNIQTGVIVSRKGMTGQGRARQGARQAILKEYLLHGTAVLVLDDTAIDEVAAGRSKLSTALLEQFEAVRFDIV